MDIVIPNFQISPYLLIGIFMALSVWWGKIDLPGAFVGGIIAGLIFLGGGWLSLGLLFLFFVMGSIASSWKISWKQEQGLAEKNKGKRSVVNAVSNGGAAALCGLLAYFFPEHVEIFIAAIAGSFASASADTLSSELGNIYGKRYINILTLETGERGKDGIISFEGTLLGALGALIIALIYGLWFHQPLGAVIVLLAGVLGNAFDSILGASLQSKGYLNNHTVNVANTFFAAFIAGLLFGIIL